MSTFTSFIFSQYTFFTQSGLHWSEFHSYSIFPPSLFWHSRIAPLNLDSKISCRIWTISKKIHNAARVADHGSNHHANCCWQPYAYSTPVIMSRHSGGTGFIALMKSSEPSAPQHPTYERNLRTLIEKSRLIHKDTGNETVTLEMVCLRSR